MKRYILNSIKLTLLLFIMLGVVSCNKKQKEPDPIKETYQIIYDLDGGINTPDNPTSFIQGDTNITLKDPSKEGYKFLGWYVNEELVTSINTLTTSDIKVLAKWEKEETPLTLILGSATINVSSSTYLEITDYLDTTLFNVTLSNDVISIDEYMFIKGEKVGTCIINVSLKTDSSVKGSIPIEVIEAAPIITTISNKVAIDSKTALQIKNLNELTENSLDDFNWTVDNSNIAIIETDGYYLKGLSTGIVTVTATSKTDSRVFTTQKVSVVDPNLTAVLGTSDAKYNYYVGEMFDLNLLGSKYTQAEFTWNTSNSEILRVLESGQIIGVNPGNTSINIYEKKNPSNRATYTINILAGGNVDYVGNLLTTALSQLGYVEEEGNYTKYGEWYSLNPGAWCAMFVSWCFYQTGISTDVMLKYCSCSAGEEWSREQGIFHEKASYTPVPGDVIFFTSSGMSHTGLVAYVEGGYMYTIEGNASDKVGIWRWSLKDARITGFAHPNYPSFEGKVKDFSYLALKDQNGNYYWSNVAEKQPVL